MHHMSLSVSAERSVELVLPPRHPGDQRRRVLWLVLGVAASLPALGVYLASEVIELPLAVVLSLVLPAVPRWR
jgi:hypothetical protein